MYISSKQIFLISIPTIPVKNFVKLDVLLVQTFFFLKKEKISLFFHFIKQLKRLKPCSYELEPKKWICGSGGGTKYNIDFYYFLEKYDELSESVAFGQNLRYFAGQNGPKGGHKKINFDFFQIQK